MTQPRQQQNRFFRISAEPTYVNLGQEQTERGTHRHQLVGLLGRAGSGKSLAADYLIERHGYVRTKIAGGVKTMLRSVGLTYEQLEGSEKELPLAMLGGQTPRMAMQTLGTEWGRNTIWSGIWLNLWRTEVEALLKAQKRVVVDDLRFPNEVALVRELGGLSLQILRGENASGDHSSENQELSFDSALTNDRDPSQLYTQLETKILWPSN